MWQPTHRSIGHYNLLEGASRIREVYEQAVMFWKSPCWQGAFKTAIDDDDDKPFHPCSPACHLLLPIFSLFIFGLWKMWASSYITNRKFWITNRSGHGLAEALPSDTSPTHHWVVGDEQPSNPLDGIRHIPKATQTQRLQERPCVTILTSLQGRS